MKGDLVSLRPLTDEDYELVVRWLDGRAGAYANGGPTFCTGREFKQSAGRSGETHLLVVTGEDEPVGAVSWRTLGYVGNYAVGLVIGEPGRWLRGYGAAAYALLLRHLFHGLNAHRIEVTSAVYNKETMKIVTRGMMTLEGVLRDYAFFDGAYHDVVVCSLLRDEYDALLAEGRLGKRDDAIPVTDRTQALELLLTYLAESGDKYLSSLLVRRQEPAYG
jgi:RimJ/RimL family protein N-acetyltransferase